ncbi:MAG: ribonuclease 3 [Fimbriimonadales bacterium]|nr:MAG: ribonuclease 3 [Fimbriimonadales bacterium]GIV10895.1 MAG: ribonuclease 3 [Fimbriimonadales bacterium]
MRFWRLRKAGVHLPVRNKQLAAQALTHRSHTEGELLTSNERLELLGDAVLGLIIAEHLYQHYPHWDQGQLSKARASLVRASVLCEAAKRTGIAQYLRLSPSEEASGGRERPSILADAFEAVLGAIYLDSGYKAARDYAIEYLKPELDALESGEMPIQDFKSQLQERTQAWWRITPTYEVVEELGTPHNKTFIVHVKLRDVVAGRGVGSSKKQAEQNAAAHAMEYTEQNRRHLDETFGYG